MLKDNIKLIEYDYYNFAKINNDVVKNHVTDEFNYLLFCNNDIKILNDVVYKMVSIFNTNHTTGTVGSRLYYGDNTLQHNGVIIYYNPNNNKIYISHEFLGSYYRSTLSVTENLGNTAALMMTKKTIFNKIMGFSEKYEDCFEDVEYNIMCKSIGLKNIFDGTSVAYHLESQTRNLDSNKLEKQTKDWNKLTQIINKHRDFISDKIQFTNSI